VVSAFLIGLNNFISNPVCSASDLRRPLNNNQLSDGLFRRQAIDLDSKEAVEWHAKALIKRDLSASGGDDFLNTLIIVMLGQTIYSLQLQQAWDNLMQPLYSFTASDFKKYVQEFSIYDLNYLARDLMCNIGLASAVPADYNDETSLCVEPISAKRRDVEVKDSKVILGVPVLHNDTVFHGLVKRPFSGSNGQALPWTGRILDAVIAGTIPLLYIRQLNYHGELNLEGKQFSFTELANRLSCI
jgi:hypothetical protein